jgi:Protein of unknown function (DUF433)
MGGQPCIRGLRFPVASVVAMLADGMGTGEILAEHPDLTAEDIHESPPSHVAGSRTNFTWASARSGPRDRSGAGGSGPQGGEGGRVAGAGEPVAAVAPVAADS